MRYLKTYEGLFDFFKKGEADDLVIGYTNRLKKVRGISPYPIKKDDMGSSIEDKSKKIRYEVTFDDTPIEISGVVSTDRRSFTSEYRQSLIDSGYSELNGRSLFMLKVQCDDDEWIILPAIESYLKELWEICDKVYKEDLKSRSAKRIKKSYNTAADIL